MYCSDVGWTEILRSKLYIHATPDILYISISLYLYIGTIVGVIQHSKDQSSTCKMLCSCATHSLPTVRSLPNEEGGVGPFLGQFGIFFFFEKQKVKIKMFKKSFLTISTFYLLVRA